MVGLPFSMVCSRYDASDLGDRVLMYCFLAIPGAVSRHVDNSWGRQRTEITCTACGGHLGHVFKGEGFNTPSEYSWLIGQPNLMRVAADERHCVNSVSLTFKDGAE